MSDDNGLVECDECGREGLRERIEDSPCPHSGGGGRGRVESVGGDLDAFACVRAVDTVPPDVDPTGKWVVEIVVEGATIPPQVLDVLADVGLQVRPGASDTQGRPVHAVVVAEA